MNVLSKVWAVASTQEVLSVPDLYFKILTRQDISLKFAVSWSEKFNLEDLWSMFDMNKLYRVHR